MFFSLKYKVVFFSLPYHVDSLPCPTLRVIRSWTPYSRASRGRTLQVTPGSVPQKIQAWREEGRPPGESGRWLRCSPEVLPA